MEEQINWTITPVTQRDSDCTIVTAFMRLNGYSGANFGLPFIVKFEVI